MPRLQTNWFPWTAFYDTNVYDIELYKAKPGYYGTGNKAISCLS